MKQIVVDYCRLKITVVYLDVGMFRVRLLLMDSWAALLCVYAMCLCVSVCVNVSVYVCMCVCWCAMIRLSWRRRRSVRLIRKSLLRSWIMMLERAWLDRRRKLTRKSEFHSTQYAILLLSSRSLTTALLMTCSCIEISSYRCIELLRLLVWMFSTYQQYSWLVCKTTLVVK